MQLKANGITLEVEQHGSPNGEPLLLIMGLGMQQVIHGLADPLVPAAAGRDLAARIGNAKLDLVEGMGHDLPVALWPRFADGIGAAASRV